METGRNKRLSIWRPAALIAMGLLLCASCGGATSPVISDGLDSEADSARAAQKRSDKPVSVPDASPREGGVPLEVHLWDAGSYDEDGEIVKWEWNFGDEHEGKGGWHDYTASAGDVWHTYKHPGTQVAHLRVTDDDGNRDVAFVKIVMRPEKGPPDEEPKDESEPLWPMFGYGPAHTRCSPIVGAQTGSLKWMFDLGDFRVESSPAIGADGTIYVGSAYSTNKVFAVNPDGSLKWSFSTDWAVRSSPAIGADGTIYVGCDDDNVYAINADGTLKWSYLTGGDVFSSPTIGPDGMIYVGSFDGKLHALDPDGGLKWAYVTGDYVHSSPAIGTDGTVYVGSDDGRLHAVDPDGNGKWTFLIGQWSWVWSSPAVGADGTIYVGGLDGYLYALAPDGGLKWSSVNVGSLYSSPAIGPDGTVYAASLAGGLYAFSSDGILQWSYAIGGAYSSPAIGADGTIYIGSRDRNLYAIDAGGNLKWSYACPSWVEASPAIGLDGAIYVTSFDMLIAIGPSM